MAKKTQKHRKMALIEGHRAKIIMLCIVLLMAISPVFAFEFDNKAKYDSELKKYTIKDCDVWLGTCLMEGETLAELELKTPLRVLVPRGYQKVAEFEICNFKEDYGNAFKKIEFFDGRNDWDEIDREFDYKYLSELKKIQVDNITTECHGTGEFKEVCNYKADGNETASNGTLIPIYKKVCEDVEIEECEEVNHGKMTSYEEVWVTFEDISELKKGKCNTIGIFTEVKKNDKIEWIPTIMGESLIEWATWEEFNLNTDLFVYYDFDEITGTDADDSIGNYDGTATSSLIFSTAIDGIINTGADFTTDNWISTGIMGDFGSQLTGNLTISFWMNSTSNAIQDVMGELNDGTTTLFYIGTSSTSGGDIYFFIRDESGDQIQKKTVGNLVNDSEWHHVLITKGGNDHSDVHIYIDGIEPSYFQDTGTIDATGNFDYPMYVGNRNNRGSDDREFVGEMDELAIWQRELNETERNAIYNNGFGIPFSFNGYFWEEGDFETSLVSYYKMDEQDTSGTGTIYDDTGNHDGINAGADNDTGIINTAYDFDSECIEVPENVLLGEDEMTLSVWVTIDGGALGSNRRIYRDRQTDVMLGVNTDDHLQFSTTTSTGGLVHLTVEDTNLTEGGTWQQIVGVYNSTHMLLYVNGVLIDTTLQNGTITADSDDGNTTIGCNEFSGYGQYWAGKVDELAIWSKALSSEQVNELYNFGAGLQRGDTVLTVGLSSPIDDYNSTSSTVDFNCLITGTPYNASLWTNTTGTWEINDTNTYIPTTNSTYLMDETSGTTSYDEQGRLDGTILSGVTVNVDGFNGKGYQVDTTTSRLRYGQSSAYFQTSNGFSYSFWIKFTDMDNGYIFNSGDGANNQFRLRIQDGHLLFRPSPTATESNSTTQLSANQWYHVVVTRESNGGSQQIYINGTLEDEDSGIYTTTNLDFYLGIASTTQSRLSANFIIDEFKVWNGKILSQEEVTSLYEEFDNDDGGLFTIAGIPDGTFDWTCSINNGTDIFADENRTFNVDSTNPIITIFEPNGTYAYGYFGMNTTLNFSAVDSNLESCWYVTGSYNESITEYNPSLANWFDDDLNTSVPTLAVGNYTIDLPEGTTGLIRERYGYGGWCDDGEEYYRYEYDLSSCSNETIYLNVETVDIYKYYRLKCDEDQLFYWWTGGFGNPESCGDGESELWANIGGETEELNCSLGIDYFNLTDDWEITVYGEDSFGNVGYATSTWDYIITNESWDTSPANNSIVVSGDTVTFTLQVNASNIPTTNANFWFNGTMYSPTTTTAHTNRYIFTYDFDTTAFGNSSGEIVPWYWNFSFEGYEGEASTYEKDIIIYTIGFDNCSVYNETLLNISLYDEETKTLIAYTDSNIEIDLSLSSLTGGGYWDFNYTWFNDSDGRVSVCVPEGILNLTEWELNLLLSYEADGYVNEFYYIDSQIYNSSKIVNYLNPDDQGNLSLYLLQGADSTSFLFNFYDVDGLPNPNSIVHVFRQYIGSGLFREVERARADQNGDTIVHLVEEDVIYYFLISEDSETIYISSTYSALCQEVPCAVVLEAGGEFESLPSDFDLIDGGGFSVTDNENTRTVTMDYQLEDTATMSITAYKYNDDGTYSAIATNSSTDTSDSLTLSIPQSAGNVSFFYAVSKNGEHITSRWINWEERLSDNVGIALSLFLAFLIVLTLVLIAVNEGGGETIVFTILGVLFAGALGLVQTKLSVAVSLVMYLIASGGIIIWKLVKRNG